MTAFQIVSILIVAIFASLGGLNIGIALEQKKSGDAFKNMSVFQINTPVLKFQYFSSY